MRNGGVLAALVVFGAAIACGNGAPPAESGDFARPPPGVASGPCAPEGKTRSCHFVLGEHGGVLDCFNGSQVCSNGVWGPCEGSGDGATIATRTKPLTSGDEASGGIAIRSLGSPDASGPPCSSDPCNPYCIGYDERPPVPIAPSGCSVKSTTSLGSFVAAPMCSLSTVYWRDNAVGCTSGSKDDCFFGDTCCAAMTAPTCGYTKASTNYCVARSVAGCGANPGCGTAVDYTAPPACENASDGHIHQSVCNRGGADAPTSGLLWLSFFDSKDFRKECGGCGPGFAKDKFSRFLAYCSIDLAKIALKASACVDVDVTAALAGAPAAGTACVFDSGKTLADLAKDFGVYVNMAQKSGAVAATCSGAKGLAECNDCNNWGAMDWTANKHPACPTVTTTSSTPQPLTYAQTYAAACPPGTKGQWNALSYDVVAPAGSDVKFAVQAGPAPGGPWTPATAVQVADAPVDHPATCATTGPAPSCPVGVFDALGKTPNAQQPELNVSITLTPAAGSCKNVGTPMGDICGLPGGCNGPKARAQKEPCSTLSDCNYDTCCAQNGASACVSWVDAPKTYQCAPCNGVDYTVPVGCKDPSGHQRFSVCNRGTQDSPNTGTLTLGFYTDNPSNPQCAPFTVDKGYCTLDLSVVGPIPAGGCADIDVDAPTPGVNCSGANMNGNRAVFVNHDKAQLECNYCNNTSFNNGGQCVPYNPPPAMPQLKSWQVSYSCVPSE